MGKNRAKSAVQNSLKETIEVKHEKDEQELWKTIIMND